MPNAGRKYDLSLVPADKHECPACPHVAIGIAITGSEDVLINDRSALRQGDMGVHIVCCGENTWQASSGSPTVLINEHPAHRLIDIDTHCGGIGLMITGSPNVIIGGGSGLGAFLISFAAGKLGGMAGNKIANLEKLQKMSPLMASAFVGATSGAVSGAAAGAMNAAVSGQGVSGILKGLRDSALGGSLSGAIGGIANTIGESAADKVSATLGKTFDALDKKTMNPIEKAILGKLSDMTTEAGAQGMGDAISQAVAGILEGKSSSEILQAMKDGALVASLGGAIGGARSKTPAQQIESREDSETQETEQKDNKDGIRTLG